MTDGMDPRPRNGLSLFAGGGGLDMGLMLAEPGFHTRCFVEWEEYPQQVLIGAQRAGYFAPAPIWDDVRAFDGRALRGAIDTILAGYPCQGESYAGKRLLAGDPRWMWPDVERLASEIRPRWLFLENVRGHLTGGAETVLRRLRDMGFAAATGLFTAAETGAPHERCRWFTVAYSPDNCRFLADADDTGSQGQLGKVSPPEGRQEQAGHAGPRGGAGLFPPAPDDIPGWVAALAVAAELAPAVAFGDLAGRAGELAQMVAAGELAEAAAESALCRMADGLALRTRALKLLGNGVFPLAAAHAWRSLSAAHGLRPLDLATASGAAAPIRTSEFF